MNTPVISIILWRTILIGTHPSIKSILNDVSWRSIEGAEYIPENLELSDTPISVDLVCEKMDQHGFDDEERFIRYMLDRGYMICPSEVGPQLRRQWRVQSSEDVRPLVRIVMNPIYIDDPDHRFPPRRFDLLHKGQYGKPVIGFFPSQSVTHWVFIRPTHLI